jgi:hypothetical protein
LEKTSAWRGLFDLRNNSWIGVLESTAKVSRLYFAIVRLRFEDSRRGMKVSYFLPFLFNDFG